MSFHKASEGSAPKARFELLSKKVDTPADNSRLLAIFRVTPGVFVEMVAAHESLVTHWTLEPFLTCHTHATHTCSFCFIPT